jgi:CHAD domain-containing protein
VAYRLQLAEHVSQGIKRIVREEIDVAVRHLTAAERASRDEGIHEARKSVKKIRGALRLVQPEMGEIYSLENALFRDIGRHLSQFRDAGAVIETFDELRKKYRDDLDGRSLAPMRRSLVARKAQAEKHANIAQVLSGMAGALSRSAARVSAWPLSKDGFPAIATGLEDTFRRGQKAMARARKHPRPENYHEWRKRVKEHWYHIRLLEDLWNHGIETYEKNLKGLEASLGDDHNLVVLQEKVLAEPAFYGTKLEMRLFVGTVDKYHRDLRGKALETGEGIYKEKPGRFTRRVRRLWDAWQAPPETHVPQVDQ